MYLPKLCFCLFLLLFLKVVFSAPHKEITTVIQVLQSLGLKAISSNDDFQRSLKCEACGSVLHFSKSSQAIWALKRHSVESSHQIKAGWLLNEKNVVQQTKPKGCKSLTSFFKKRTENSALGAASSTSLNAQPEPSLQSKVMANYARIKVVSETKTQVMKELGSKLGRSICETSAAKMCSGGSKLCGGKQSDDFQVRSIVEANVKKFAEKKLKTIEKVHETVLSSTISSASKTSNLAINTLRMIRQGNQELNQKTLREYRNILACTKTSATETKNSLVIQHLLSNMVEHYILKDTYEDKVKQLTCMLQKRELTIHQLLDREQARNNQMARSIPDLAITLAALIDSPDSKAQSLVPVLKDLLLNRDRRIGKRWSDETKSLFAIILDYGGPALSKLVTDKIGGPQLHTIYRSARCSYAIPTTLDEISFERAASFYKSIGYSGLFLLAIDATAITPVLKVRGNRIVGLATNEEVLVTSAQDIISLVNNENVEKAKQANAFILAPLQEKVPAFLLAISPVVKGQDHAHVRHWYNQAKLWGGRNQVFIIGVGADGDSKVRKYYMDSFKHNVNEDGNEIIAVDHHSLEFYCVVEDLSHLNVPTAIPQVMFPDWRHLIKKWRNQLLNVKRILILGHSCAQIEHLMKTYEKDKMRCGLWKSDVFVKDKQNVDAALRILQPEVRVCLNDLKSEKTLSTRVYLRMGYYMLQAFSAKDVSVEDRSKYAWSPVCFLRYWKAWLTVSGYSLDDHFVSSQTCQDFILAGHSIILSIKMMSLHFPQHPFHPWTFGSNACEEMFSKLRSCNRGRSDLCMLDMIDYAGRLQKLRELKVKGTKVPSHTTPQWPENIEEHIKRGMEAAEKEVVRTLELLDMVPALEKANILKRQGSNIICLNPPEMQAFTEWIQEDQPDENDVISSDELLELDNNILLNSISKSGSVFSDALIDLAATTSLNTAESESENDDEDDDEDDEEDEDEDSPTHCTLYKLKQCKYQDTSFKQPRTTRWIECGFPYCGRWYHEQCLSLQFQTDQARALYSLICPKHEEIQEHFPNKLTISEDEHPLEDENKSLQPLPKRMKRFDSTNTEHRTDYALHPNYVEYEGNYFHISEFLSLQLGKVYRPAMSRLSRWVESARNDFYERIEKTVNPVRAVTGVYLNDIIAVWVPSKGLHIGMVMRIIRAPSLKSAFPIFEWTSDKTKSEKVTVCINTLLYKQKSSNAWDLTAPNPPNVNWCDAASILRGLGHLKEETTWPVTVDLTNIIKELPILEKMDKERENRELLLRREEENKIKSGCEEDMTVKLLKEVLQEMGVPFKKNSKKAELIIKVKEARRIRENETIPAAQSANENMMEFDNSGGSSIIPNTDQTSSLAKEEILLKLPSFFSHFRMHDKQNPCSRSNSRLPTAIYYYDEKKERAYLIIIHLLFLLEMLGSYLDKWVLTYVVELIIRLFYVMLFLGIPFAYLLLLDILRQLFTSTLNARINITPFLEGVAFC